MSSANHANARPSAGFVSGLSWSFIGLSAFTLLLAAAQYVLFVHVVPMEPLRAAFTDAINLKLLPPSALKILAHLPSILIVLFAASLLTLLISISLLKRKNWARIAFAAIMIATALLHFAGLLLPFYFMQEFADVLNSMPPEVRGVASAMMKMLSAMSMVMGIAFGVAFGWIAMRLFSAEIIREFAATDDMQDARINPPWPPTP
jgi:hypothetical protein